ncbi:MAG TPA: RES family NAD+ phosphorylase [Ramlibacter sp.]|uniref:RES family NAD+ phosphorylase n=1 Tax=Ramlibacter sp. TaxID=1917967 RepID=UPI002BBE2196|nr:RES family NAD+ phosphorylase [Ramlibacter sp.]HVZ44346.1 RES family NAD+ phosphorylase [Ramlibacter sp.]
MSGAGSLAARLDPAHLGLYDWPGGELHRVHPLPFGPSQFNGRADGYSARFSPLQLAHGAVVPTMYAGSTLDVALMETVFHDAPRHSAGFILRMSRSNEHRRAARVAAPPMRLADFTGVGLRKLGLARASVIDSAKSAYPRTQLLARWVHAHPAKPRGIVWSSRQDDAGLAFVLFGDRVAARDLAVVAGDLPLTSGAVQAAIQALATRLGAAVFLDT